MIHIYNENTHNKTVQIFYKRKQSLVKHVKLTNEVYLFIGTIKQNAVY